MSLDHSPPRQKLGKRLINRQSRGSLTILFGAAGGQVATALASPVISRIYSPSEVGLFSVVLSIAMMLGVAGALRYELAIPLPRQPQDAESVVGIGLCCIVATTGLGLMAAAPSRSWLADRLNQPGLHEWLFAAPLLAAVIAAFSLFSQAALRQQNYRAVGRRNLVQSVATNALQIGLGLISLKTGGMTVGYGAGQLLGTVTLAKAAGILTPSRMRTLRLSQLREVAVRYIRFPLVLLPSGFLNILGLQLPLVLMSMLYGSQVAGWVGMSQRILALPLSLVGAAIGQVFMSELARSTRQLDGGSKQMFLAASKKLVALAALIFVVITVAGPWLFSFALGDEWRESGVYARALALGLAGQLVASPLSQTLVVLERQWLQLAWDAARTVAVVAAVLIGHQLGSVVGTVWALSIVSGLAYVLSWILSYRALVTFEKKLSAEAETDPVAPVR
ncbi:lipopolysaccharide biosynthesis protein [Actinoplanes sp. NPDC049265]|uniref:lipopolysaccharide biosynthesis protein n=1 Tax=Actinoplanes sp. NPDC049265 TaxID=3363902 RepID=UPI003719AEBF